MRWQLDPSAKVATSSRVPRRSMTHAVSATFDIAMIFDLNSAARCPPGGIALDRDRDTWAQSPLTDLLPSLASRPFCLPSAGLLRCDRRTRGPRLDSSPSSDTRVWPRRGPPAPCSILPLCVAMGSSVYSAALRAEIAAGARCLQSRLHRGRRDRQDQEARLASPATSLCGS